MTRHSDGLNVSPEARALIDRGWDGPAEEGEVLEQYGDPVTGALGVDEQHGWDLDVDGVTVMSLDAMNKWLQLRGIAPDEFKRYTSYLSNVGRDGFQWLRAL